MKGEIVPRQSGSLIVPFVLVFGFYVIFHGEKGPGGGFQGGVILASGLVLFSLLHRIRHLRRVLSQRVTTGLAATGLLIYALVGVAALLRGGQFLQHSVLFSIDYIGHEVGISVIEFGIGLAVAAVMLTIFDELYED